LLIKQIRKWLLIYLWVLKSIRRSLGRRKEIGLKVIENGENFVSFRYCR
jgi:hypothetical protein